MSAALGVRASVAWRRLRQALGDPIRRRHLVAQVVLVGAPAWLVAGSLARAAVIVAAYYALYEYVAEPLTTWLIRRARRRPPSSWFARVPWAIVVWLGRSSWVGPYWERSPREGEAYPEDNVRGA